MYNISERKREAAKIISENCGNRKVVIWGKRNVEFENYLFQEYGLEVAFGVCWDKRLIDGDKYRSMNCLADNKDKYYVINPELPKTEKNISYFISHGYKDMKDFYFFGLPNAVVPKGKVNYFDDRDNTCSYCPPNCTITFRGKNSQVIIDESVTVKGELKITLEDNCKVFIGKNCIVGKGTILFSGDNAVYTMHPSVAYNSPDAVLYSNSVLEIGKGTTIVGTMIRICHYNTVHIDEDCMLSRDIIMFCGDGHAIFDCKTRERTNYPLDSKINKYYIHLHKHTWVGIHAIILGGTDVGKGSIIGAGSIVKGKYPNNCVIAGNPAKVVRRDTAWSREYMDLNIESCGEDFYELTKDYNN